MKGHMRLASIPAERRSCPPRIPITQQNDAEHKPRPPMRKGSWARRSLRGGRSNGPSPPASQAASRVARHHTTASWAAAKFFLSHSFFARPHRQLQQTLGMRPQRCKRREGCPASRERGPRGLRCSVPGACPSESPEQRQRLAIEAPALLFFFVLLFFCGDFFKRSIRCPSAAATVPFLFPHLSSAAQGQRRRPPVMTLRTLGAAAWLEQLSQPQAGTPVSSAAGCATRCNK